MNDTDVWRCVSHIWQSNPCPTLGGDKWLTAAVLTTARNPDHPLHNRFDWGSTQHTLLEQARLVVEQARRAAPLGQP